MDNSRFAHLMTRLLDDTLTHEELGELTQLLRVCPELLGQLQEHLEVADWIAQAEDELRDGARFVAATLARTGEDRFVSELRGKIDDPVMPSRRSWRWSLVVLAVAAVAVCLMVLIIRPTPPPSNYQLARITEVNGSVQWTGDGGHVESETLAGRPIGGGRLESLSVDSWAVLEYSDGSKITLAGRSQLTVVDGAQKELRLGQGRFSASVARQAVGKPMVIHTPTAKLEVLGTQLNVDSDSTSTVVNVNEGRVRVTRLVDGSVVDVPADHQAVATVNRHSAVRVTRRLDPVGVWRSVFPHDAKYGQWQVNADGFGSVRATSLLLTCGQPKPLLLFATVANVTNKDESPPVLGSEGRFLVRGRVESTADVVFGMTMNHPKGGFAGKYVVVRKVEAANGGKAFEWALPLSEFKPLEKTFPDSPAGLELVDCWCLTVHEDHGLSVFDIELQSDKH